MSQDPWFSHGPLEPVSPRLSSWPDRPQMIFSAGDDPTPKIPEPRKPPEPLQDPFFK